MSSSPSYSRRSPFKQGFLEIFTALLLFGGVAAVVYPVFVGGVSARSAAPPSFSGLLNLGAQSPEYRQMYERVRRQRAGVVAKVLSILIDATTGAGRSEASSVSGEAKLPAITTEDPETGLSEAFAGRGSFDWAEAAQRVLTFYRGNAALSGKSLKQLGRPAKEVVVYWERDPGEGGARWVIFADFQARMVPAEEWARIVVAQKLTVPKSVATSGGGGPLKTITGEQAGATAEENSDEAEEDPLPSKAGYSILSYRGAERGTATDSAEHWRQLVRSRRQVSASGIKQLCLALLAYSQDYDELLPTASSAVEAGKQMEAYLHGQPFVDPISDAPYGWNVKIAGGSSRNAADKVAFWDPVPGLDNQRTIGFVSGSVVRWPEDRFAEYMKKNHIPYATVTARSPVRLRIASLMARAGNALRLGDPPRAVAFGTQAMALAKTVSVALPSSRPSSPRQDPAEKRLKSVGFAVMMYLQDYDEMLPPAQSAAQLGDYVMPYLKKRDGMVEPTTGLSYGWNVKLAGRSMASFDQDLPGIYEPAPGADSTRRVFTIPKGEVVYLPESEFQKQMKEMRAPVAPTPPGKVAAPRFVPSPPVPGQTISYAVSLSLPYGALCEAAGDFPRAEAAYELAYRTPIAGAANAPIALLYAGVLSRRGAVKQAAQVWDEALTAIEANSHLHPLSGSDTSKPIPPAEAALSVPAPSNGVPPGPPLGPLPGGSSSEPDEEPEQEEAPDITRQAPELYAMLLVSGGRAALEAGDLTRALERLEKASRLLAPYLPYEPRIGKSFDGGDTSGPIALRIECLGALADAYERAGRTDRAQQVRRAHDEAGRIASLYRTEWLLLESDRDGEGMITAIGPMMDSVLAMTGGEAAAKDPALNDPVVRETLKTAFLTLPDNLADEAMRYVRLTNVLLQRGFAAEAVDGARTILDRWENTLGSDHPAIAATRVVLGTALYRTGESALAEEACSRAVVSLERGGLTQSEWYAQGLLYRALAQRAQGRNPEALQTFRQCLTAQQRAVESRFVSASSESDLREFVVSLAPSLAALTETAALPGADPATVHTAAEWTLRRKGIVFDALARLRGLQTQSADDPELSRRLAALRQAQQNLADQQATLLSGKVAATTPPPALRTAVEAVNQAEAAVNGYLNTKATSLPESRRLPTALAGLPDNPVTSLQAALPARTALIEYVRVTPPAQPGVATGPTSGTPTDRYYAFVITRDRVQLVDLGPVAAIEDAVHVLRRHLDSGERGVSGQQVENTAPVAGRDEAGYRTAAAALTRLVFTPLQPALGDQIETLYLAPDGELNRVPFEGLLADAADPAHSPYWIERYRAAYLSTGRDLFRYQVPATAAAPGPPATPPVIFAAPDFDLAPSEEPARLTALGITGTDLLYRGQRSQGTATFRWSPLPGARAEGERVHNLLPGSRLLSGGDALEVVLKVLPASPRILHLATHGFFVRDPDALAGVGGENPLIRSGVVLAAANHAGDASASLEDGYVTAEEVAQLRLDATELVVLSACETGLGDIQVGEGVYGLRRSFLLAGARAELISLFAIPDAETAQLMEGFYGGLPGQGGAAALRNAQLDLIKKRRAEGKSIHPYFWAGFIYVGPAQK